MIDFPAIRASQLKPFVSYHTGNAFASLLALKEKPGKTEFEGGLPFSGADGLALDKAFGKLGWGFGSGDTRTWSGILLAPHNQTELSSDELRLICEIIDPLTIVALDEGARVALIAAFTSAEEGMLINFLPGKQCEVLGRRLVSVEGFEDSLADDHAKQKAWAQLKQSRFES